MIKNTSTLITGTLAALGLFNLLYWTGKFFGFFPFFFDAVNENWLLLMLLEALAVASVFVDTIVRWDKFEKNEKKIRIGLTAIFFVALLLRFALSYMELLMTGEVK